MVFGTEETNPVMSRILGFLMDILLGWVGVLGQLSVNHTDSHDYQFHTTSLSL